MKFTNLLSDEPVMRELGHRFAAARIERQLTQAQVAEEAGVSKRTVERLEDGVSIQLGNLIRCLRALGMVESLERFLPETPINPVELLKFRGATRSRVRAKTTSPAANWTWGDQK